MNKEIETITSKAMRKGITRMLKDAQESPELIQLVYFFVRELVAPAKIVHAMEES